MKPLARRNKNGEIVSFQLRVFTGRSSDGKPKLVTKKWKPEKNKQFTEKQLIKEANKQQALFENEVEKLGITSSGIFDISPKISFEAFADKWITEYCEPHNKIRTVVTYKGRLKRINAAIGHISLCKLNPNILREFLNNLSEPGVKLTGKTKSGLSSKTIKDYYSLISSILSTAVKWRIIPENPMDLLDPPRVKRNQVKSLSKQEVTQLLKLLEKEAPLKYKLLILTYLVGGMRRGELVGIKWDNLDFDNCLIKIKTEIQYAQGIGIYEDTPKSESSVRVIKMPRWIFDLFLKYKIEQDKRKARLKDKWEEHGYVFTKWNGLPMHPNTPYDWFNKFQKAHNLPHYSIHALRHTTATLLILDGVNEKLVSGRLGHSSTSTTTNIYAEYIQEADALVSDTLDNIIKLKPDQ